MSDFHDPSELSLWQQLEHTACLCDLKRTYVDGLWPPQTLPGRVIMAIARAIAWLQWLGRGYVRCPFCGCWYMNLSATTSCWECAMCGERWACADWMCDHTSPMRPVGLMARWAAEERRHRTPVGWLRWQQDRAIGRTRDAWYALQSAWQRLTRGYALEEVWDLNDHLVAWVLPRLRAMQAAGPFSHPWELTAEQWEEYVGEMVRSLDIWDRDRRCEPLTEEEQREVYAEDSRYDRGLDLFGQWWRHLWQ